PPLPIPMVEPSFRTLLVAAIGAAPLTKPGLRAARDAAIPLPAVATRAEEEDGAALPAHADPYFEDYFVIRRQPSLQRAWTTAEAPWPCQNRLVWLPLLRRLPTRVQPLPTTGPQVASRLRCHLTLFEQDDD